VGFFNAYYTTMFILQHQLIGYVYQNSKANTSYTTTTVKLIGEQ